MKIITGNIFTTKMQTIVNTVNCFGVMGAGLALECKYRYPDMYIKYKEMCDKKLLDIGKLYLYKTHNKWILNFPTKNHWKYESKPEYLEKGLSKLVNSYKIKGIESIAFPLLGTQNGGLSIVESINILEKYLNKIDIPFEVYSFEPYAPDDLFENFRQSFQKTNIVNLKKLTGIKENQIEQIIALIKNNEIRTMAQITQFQGLTKSTILKCYKYAMRSDILNNQINLF